ncbi:unnamed protein product (macronuclear) [Paramecium tetraurelia]|uniref:H-type lectin domain-containing protein n=1 Tax=Paramecium tetraurelia TaxID=5888 RepID=A0D4W1_PARTE|nr:uncharacterized protein GSPATT00013525001 [Paramecium tetraurelia]CAK78078.1 unnamed protein product [Paramecium tetraurelia]|eukprot:XP_001445475.1 hypothetical protein (macronuclear) [Paramecium tetraurelia strain d4-2]
MNFRFLILLITITFAYDKVKAESQTEKSITLEDETLIQDIKFSEAFLEAPVIYITLTKLSMAGQKYGFEIDITDVNTKGFKLIYRKYINDPITLQVQWLAIFDPRVEVAYYTSFKQQLIVPVYEDNFAYSIIGLQGSSSQVGIQVEKIDNGNAYLQVTNSVKMIKLCIISGSKHALYPKFIPFSVSNNHPWLKEQKGKAFINFSYDLNVNQPILIGGITEFLFKSQSIKIQLQNLKYDDKVLAEIGTWNDAQLVQAQVSILAYIIDEDLIISDKNCVELFEQCYFQGKSTKICKEGDAQSLEKEFKFRSFIVPRYKQFELANNKDVQQLMGIESCVDEIILK